MSQGKIPGAAASRSKMSEPLITGYIVARLGHWGHYPVDEDGMAYGVGIDAVHCYHVFPLREDAMRIARTLLASISIEVRAIPHGTCVNGDLRVDRLPVIFRQWRRIVLSRGIELLPDTSMGETILISSNRRRKMAQKIAERREWEVDGMPGVRPLGRVRTVRVSIPSDTADQIFARASGEKGYLALTDVEEAA